MQRVLCVILFVLKDSGTCRKNLSEEFGTYPRATPFTDFQKELEMSPIIGVLQGIEDNSVDTIIKWISDEGLSVILNLEDFPIIITSMMNTTMQVSRLQTSKLGFNFLICCDVDGLYSILKKAHQIDRHFGAGSLLRHFSKWLIVLKSGEVDSLILDDVLFDNVAVTTLQAMRLSVEKMSSELYTLMWTNSSRRLQEVSNSSTEPTLTRVFPNTKHGLNGRLLKAAVLQWETCEKKIVNGTFTYTGFCDYMLSYLSRSMNFSYIYIEPEDQSWGVQYDNGTWDGIIGMLIDGTADLCPVPYAVNYQKSLYVTFSHEFGIVSANIIYKRPESRVNWTVMLDCFKWQTYVYGFVVLVGVSVLSLIFKQVSSRKATERRRNTFAELILTIFGVPFKQGSPTLPATDSQRILLCSWWLFCIVITSVYCGNLVAYLSVAKDNIPFTGLDDLLESGYEVGVSTGTLAEATFKASNLSLYNRIWQKIREHQPDNMSPTDDDKYHHDRLIQGFYALITNSDRIRRYTAYRCDIAATNNPFFQRFMSLVLPKNSALAGLLDHEIASLVDRGLPDHWMDLSLPEKNQCSPSKRKIFKVDSLFLALVVSGIGVTTATVILVIEKCGVGHCF